MEASSKRFTTKPLKENGRKKVSIAYHDERCPKCKETVKKLLEKIYGKVE